MKFNKYIWKLYKDSETEKRAIGGYKPFKEIPHYESFLLDFEEDEIRVVVS